MTVLKILKAEVVARVWSTVSRITVQQKFRDGRVEVLEREVVDHGFAAAVLPIDPIRGTCLLVRQIRVAAFMAGHAKPLLEVCAGLLDQDKPEACARREAQEELGYRVHDLELVCDAFVSPGAHTERVAMFLARYSPGDQISAGGGVLHEGEDIDVIEMPLIEAYGLIAKQEIIDAKSIILLQQAMLRHNGL
jgi:nudix-type nucleoside diphosphatase (YffH/AdpP family)